MTDPTSTPTSLRNPSLLALGLFGALSLAACDSNAPDVSAASETGGAERDASIDDAEPGARGRHGKHAKGHGPEKKVERLCAAVECRPEQESALLEIFTAQKAERGERPDREAMKAERKARHEALAQAFLSDDFTGETLAELSQGRGGKHRDPAQMAETFAAVHAVLDAEQRAKIAEHPMSLMGGHHKKGKHGKKGKQGKQASTDFEQGSSSDKAAKHEARRAEFETKFVSSVCETVSCDASQQAELTKLVGEARPPKPDPTARKAERDQIAALWTASSFDQAAFTELMGAHADQRQAMKVHRAELLVGLHDLLRPEQRAALVNEMQNGEGPLRHMLAGKGGKHGKHGKHGKRGRKGGKQGKRGAEGPEVQG